MITQKIADELQISERYVRLVAKTASHRYKTYEIAKKTGGSRTIHHPSRELKLLQAWLVENLFSKLPVHPAASAYKPGSSIRRHANLHRRNNFLLRVDFRDFFPSIGGTDVVRVLRRKFGSSSSPVIGPADYNLVRALVCRNDRLTIGAPSSPILSNAVMYEFDLFWASKCQREKIVYSRYADDLYFSTNRRDALAPLLQELQRDVRGRPWPVLQINEQKTVFTSRKRRKLVTGLIITPQGNLSLGRKRKRYIKSLLMRFTRGQLAEEQHQHLRGLIAFAESVEPTFVRSLEAKYGVERVAVISQGGARPTSSARPPTE